jgi:hypothetical protein
MMTNDHTSSSPSRSPSPDHKHAARPGGWPLALGLLLAPGAWFVQTNLAQTIAAWGCFPHDRPVTHPAMTWLGTGIVILAVCALVIGGIGASIAWRNWKMTGVIVSEIKEQATIDRHTARDVFIARAGALGSALFVFALIATDLAWWIVSPCGGHG